MQWTKEKQQARRACTLPGAPVAEFGFVGGERMQWERHLFRYQGVTHSRCVRCYAPRGTYRSTQAAKGKGRSQ